MKYNKQKEDWVCGGWDEAELNTLRDGMKMTLIEKLQWLEQAQKLADQLLKNKRSRVNNKPIAH